MEAREYKYGGGAATRDFRKAFGQFSSMKTQRVDTLKPMEIQLDAQEDVAGGVHPRSNLRASPSSLARPDLRLSWSWVHSRMSAHDHHAFREDAEPGDLLGQEVPSARLSAF